MDTTHLLEFIDIVPACADTASLTAVLDILKQSGSDRVVVLDTQQCPIGLIRTRSLLTYLLDAELDAELDGSDSLRGAIDAKLQQNIRALSTDTNPPLLEPLGILSSYQTVDQLRPHLDELTSQQWALVDISGDFLGLLDQLRLMQFWVNHASSEQVSAVPHVSAPVEPVKPHSPSTGQAAESLVPLIELLERLPLPLMLQTSQGQVVTQNLSWRQQLVELENPVELREEATAVLEAIAMKSSQMTSVTAASTDASAAIDHAIDQQLPYLLN